ncbi:MAG: hypothetical protein ACREJ5_19535 [Geminicoccaceae bacterium]
MNQDVADLNPANRGTTLLVIPSAAPFTIDDGEEQRAGGRLRVLECEPASLRRKHGFDPRPVRALQS